MNNSNRLNPFTFEYKEGLQVQINKDELYDLIDKDDDLTDKEKRDEYFSIIAEDEVEQEWQDRQ